MKRKYSEMSNEIKLTIKPIKYLKCEVCNRRVYNYRLCTNNVVYCSGDCYEVLMLSKKKGYFYDDDDFECYMNVDPTP